MSYGRRAHISASMLNQISVSDGREPKVTVHVPPEEEISKSGPITLVCLVSSASLCDYYITWLEQDGNKTGSYTDGITFPPQKTQSGFSVTSVYTTTKEKWESNFIFTCNVWSAGAKKSMTPRGVSKEQRNTCESK